jgi:hypothetical protein
MKEKVIKGVHLRIKDTTVTDKLVQYIKEGLT